MIDVLNKGMKKRKAKAKVIAVIPAYNESKYIADVVRKTKKYVDQVIVVDDCSSDNTSELAKRAALKINYARYDINSLFS